MIQYESQTNLVTYEPGCLEQAVPILSLEHSPHNKDAWVPTFVIVLNLLIPGAGTLLASHCTETDAHSGRALGVALGQLVTAPFIVGYFWALWWSLRICNKTETHHREQFRRRLRLDAKMRDQE